jgi:putative ABC transport system substrate-binding protein
MRRREFITLLGGAAAAWPLAARAQQPTMHVIGHLDSGLSPAPAYLASFHIGLNQNGFIDGRNVRVEYRGSERYAELPALAAELDAVMGPAASDR